jgi:inhibitor of KinA
MKITPLGDSALLIDVEPGVREPAEKTLRRVLSIKQAIERARIPGLIECSSSYRTVATFFDPLAATREGIEPGAASTWFENRIRKATTSSKGASLFRFRKLEIPVCVEPEFALDLADVAAHTGLSEEEVVRQYCATSFQVASVGSTPGFPYLSGLPKKLACPRRSSPRLRVPEGSVAIGGNQAGIYPMVSPGGWNVIGRTSIKLFDPDKNPPTLLRPGDRVRFRRIGREEFEDLTQANATATAWK